MNKFGLILTNYPKRILLLVFFITGFLFYYAFLSDSRLRVDFSLEQMSPENDPEKVNYDNYRSNFSREDNSLLLIYVPPTNPLTYESLSIVDSIVSDIKKIETNSNCVNLRYFPCEFFEYKGDSKALNTRYAHFTDYNDDNRQLTLRVHHIYKDDVEHKISMDGKNFNFDKNYDVDRYIEVFKSPYYTDYTFEVPDTKDDFVCLESVYEIDKQSGIYSSVSINHTSYTMVKGCPSANPHVYSLSNIKNISGDLVFNLSEDFKGNEYVYFEDCGYDQVCSIDEDGYSDYDKDPSHDDYPRGKENNNVFDCEPFDCGYDKICPPSFFKKYGIKKPDDYYYPGPDEDCSEGDVIDEDWSNVAYFDWEINGDFLDVNNNEVWDCEFFDDSKLKGIDFVKQHPFYKNIILSENDEIGGIFITLDDRVQGQDFRALFFNDLDEIINKNKSKYNWQWYDAGIPVLRTRYVELLNEERSFFIPLAFFVIMSILFFVFRQINSIVLPVICISITLVWVSALMAFVGMSINVISYLTYNLLMIIGCSNSIHVQMKYHEGLFLKKGKVGSLREVMSKMGGALFLTSFTTSIGFFSLCLTNIRLIKEFGFILGIGVFVMFIIMIIVLPVLLLVVKTPKYSMSERLIKGGSHKIIKWIENRVFKNYRFIIVSSLCLFAVVSVGMLRIDYNVSILDDLRPGNDLYENIKSVQGNMGGMFPLEVILEFENSAISKDNIIKIDEFKNKIIEIDDISSANSVSDVLSLYLAGSYNLFLEKSNCYTGIDFNKEVIPEDINELNRIFDEKSKFMNSASAFITKDHKKVRISGRMFDIKADQANAIKNEIDRIAKDIFKDIKVDVFVTGSTFLALKTADYLVSNLTYSFGLAFLIIFISMIILFKSIKLSLISVLPNIIPLMFAAAVMGFQDIKLRPTTAMTFAIALGIAVDNTIHFLARFRQEYPYSENIKDALSKTLYITGKAIMSTTLVLSLGFAVLYFSELRPNHEFGILSTIILILALFGSLLLLPSILIAVNPKLYIGKNK